MATRTSIASGNWSSGGTWDTGVPGDGDTAVIDTASGHVVTLNSAVTVGPGGATGAVAIQINSSDDLNGRLIIANGGILTRKGDILIGGRSSSAVTQVIRRFEVQAGGQDIADTGSGAARWINFTNLGGFSNLASMYLVGSSGNRWQMSQTGSGTSGIMADIPYTGYFTLDYGNVTGLTADPFWAPANLLGTSSGITPTADLDATIGRHMEFNGCGRLDMAAGTTSDMAWTLSGTFKNSIGALGAVSYAKGASTVGMVTRLAVDGLVESVNTTGVTVGDNVLVNFNGAFQSGTDSTAFARNFFHANSLSPEQFTPGSDENMTDCYFLFGRTATHNYPLGGSWNKNRTIQGCIFEKRCGGESGGGSNGPRAAPGSPVTTTFKYCIKLRNVRHTNQPLYAWNVEPTVGTDVFEVYEHCTNHVVDGNQGADVTIGGGTTGGTDPAGQCTSYQSNINYSTSTGSPHAIDQTSGGGGSGDDWVAAADCDYNGYFGLAAGTAGHGYNCTFTSGTPGAHDVSGDPGFVDDTRHFVSWAHSIDSGIALITGGSSDGDEDTSMAAAIALIMQMNDDGVDSRIADAITELLAHVREGYRPTNEAFRGAAHDATDIGAVAMAAETGPLLSADETILSLLTPVPLVPNVVVFA